DAGQWHPGDADILIVADAGYDVTRLAFLPAPRLTHRAAWLDHQGELPILEGTLIRLQAERLPGNGEPKPVWLWSSRTGLTAGQVDRLWRAFLRRFDLEHTFRLFKQTLGWTVPKIRAPEAADRWTWLIIAAHTQLRPARTLADAPKPGKAGPGRPPGSKNRRPAPHYDVGKTIKRATTRTARLGQAG
ncbi:NF041680 family putative transposase, partial [Nonomuraea sp. NPDC004297]